MVRSDEEIRLSYLLSGSCEVLPSSYIKLRSYLNIHSARIAELYDFKIFKSRDKCCPYCYTSWTFDTSSFKLLPSKKLKVKYKKRVNGETVQKETADELRNVLVLKCKVCTRKSAFPLAKNVKKKGQKEEENVKSVKKKKRKKDKSCGLLINLEKSVTPRPQPFALRKKAQSTSKKDNRIEDPMELVQENSKKIQTKSPVKLLKQKNKSKPITQPNKRLIINPFSPLAQSQLSKNKQQKLKKLKKAVKGGKDVTKTTLKDFLTLIN